MKKCLAYVLVALMMLSCLAPVAVLPAVADDGNDAAPVISENANTGVETISFSKNGRAANPYIGGLNKPFGYYFKVDESRKLLEINVDDFATYNNNTNRGTFKLYQWKGNVADTQKSEPLFAREIVNHSDHSDLLLTLPDDVVATGELYFEVICTEGAGYTPWFAEGGLANEIPGKVTGMQAYLEGNTHLPFSCLITIADRESQASFRHITWTYDFGRDLISEYGVAQTNQVEIGTAHDGYTTFTATGDDPYFRIPDDKSPTSVAADLSYIAILYRTKASVSAGEFFVNHGAANWGNDGTYASASYINDGQWHVALCDASASWGTDKTNQLYAFRFDPLISGCKAGDSVDVAWLKFFGDGEMARDYVTTANQELDDQRKTQQDAGTRVIDLATGKMPSGSTVSPELKVLGGTDFVRFVGSGDVTLPIQNLAPAFAWAQLTIRSEGLTSAELTLDGEKVSVTPTNDGYWQTADLDLTRHGTAQQVTLHLEGNGWVDLAYVAFFNRTEYRTTYVYPHTLNTHRFILGETTVPVLTCTVDETGSPYCGPGEFYGQKFVAKAPVNGVVVFNHATWSSDTDNAGTFRLWKWAGSYGATVATTPLVERALKDLPNNEDLVITFDTLPAGEYLYEVKSSIGGSKAYTGFASKNGAATEGSVSFRNGEDNGVALHSAYLTLGTGLVDKGAEYATAPTFSFDFGAHLESATQAYDLKQFSGCSVTDLCDKGYLTITSENNDPYFVLGGFPEMTSSLCDWIVIKYRTETTAQHGEFFVRRSDGVEWGQDYARSNVLFDWVADGEWHIVIVDASGVWGNVDDVTMFDLRMDPLEKPETSGESIDIAYIRMFANRKAAEAYAASEYVEGENGPYVPAPVVPIDPSSIRPVTVLDGDALNVSKKVNASACMSDATYDYDKGCVTLTATADDPHYMIYNQGTTVGRYMMIRYRTTTSGMMGEIFASSTKDAPHGGTDYASFTYVADGNWHIAVIDLAQIDEYDATSHRVNYLRFDPLAAKTGMVQNGQSVDIECIAFFENPGEAEAYVHEVPSPAATYTVRFLVNGRVIYTVTYKEGATSIEEPIVPKMPGMIGEWEPYTLNGDIDVNAVYRSATDTTEPGEETTTEPGTQEDETTAEDEPETTVPEESTASDETTTPESTSEVTTEPETTTEDAEETTDAATSGNETHPAPLTETTSETAGGCSSALACVPMLLCVLLPVAFLGGRKKKRGE